MITTRYRFGTIHSSRSTGTRTGAATGVSSGGGYPATDRNRGTSDNRPQKSVSWVGLNTAGAEMVGGCESRTRRFVVWLSAISTAWRRDIAAVWAGTWRLPTLEECESDLDETSVELIRRPVGR